MKRAAFADEAMSSVPASTDGWLPMITDGIPVEPGEADDDVGGEVLVNLIELAVVDDHLDQIDHVVRRVGVARDDRGQVLRPSGRGHPAG